MLNRDDRVRCGNRQREQIVPTDPRRLNMLVTIELGVCGMPGMQMEHEDMRKLIGHALVIADDIEMHVTVGVRNHTRLLA